MYNDEFLQETLKNAFKDAEAYNVPIGIRRYDYDNVHGWWVRVSRDKVMFRKLFSDNVHGSIQDSLKQAIFYRHEILSTFSATLKTVSKGSLPPEPEQRITRCQEKGKLRPYIYWKARWYDKDHKIIIKSFPVFTLGEGNAKAAALEAARVNHNKKPRLWRVPDQYHTQSYEPISRSDVEVLASIHSTPRRSTKEKKDEIINNDPFGFEGESKTELHKSIERDRAFRNKKISLFIEEHEKIYCELCRFNFLQYYPFLQTDIIEVHHIIPLSTLTKGTVVKLNDLILLCSNCHFAVHQGDSEENLLLAMEHFEGANK
ncbi:MAG: HNH endonuclease [Pseudomonadota bacterium]